jgi:hypothetical protein
MALDLQIERAFSDGGGTVTDKTGNLSPFTLTPERAGIGNVFSFASFSVAEFGPGESTLLFLRRDESNQEEDQALGVSFKLDPTSRVFTLDVGGQGNSRARIHLGDSGSSDNPVTTMGNVGIGTVNPNEKLEVDGNILVTGDVRLTGADCAEDFDVEEPAGLEPGMVMVISHEEKLCRCSRPYDSRVAGVLSGAGRCHPGIVLGKQTPVGNRLPLALTGKVYCKVDADYSPICVGDLLTTSPTLGHAMKAGDAGRAFGAVLGKALRALNDGQGLIPILVTLQ